MNKTDQLLTEILAELRQMNRPQPKLGFRSGASAEALYVNARHGGCWFFWDHANNSPIDVPDSTLDCIVTGIRQFEKEFKGDAKPKVGLRVEAGKSYELVFGLETFSLKTVLNGLSTADLSRPLTIRVKAGTENTVFCNVYQDGKVCGDRDVNYREMSDLHIQKMIDTISGKFHRSSPAPEPNGQGRLIEEDSSRGIIDQLTSQIKTTPPDVMARKVEAMAPTIGQTQADVLLNRIDLSDTIAQISTEMTRVGWSKKQGADFLFDAFGKRTRAELNEEQLQSFLAHLKNLPSVQLAAATGEW